MRLGDWLRKEGRTHKRFAHELGCWRSQVERWAVEPTNPRHAVPRPATMIRIFEITGGEVTPNDFYDLPLDITVKSGEPDARERAA